MTKFLNISTDNTLGGNAPSDALVVSQKAIKEYVDNQAGGGGYHPDLFTWQWADHELNDVQWLRADTFSWQSGAVYQAAYQHLVDDIPAVPTITLEDGDVYVRYANGDVAGAHHPYCWKIGNYAAYTNSETPSIGDWTFANATSYLENARITATGTGMPSPETETIAGTTISYYVAADGHKIVLPDQESNVAAIYTATGVAWYYIIDTTNQRFKLPRSSHNKYTESLSVIGTGSTLGLTSNGSNMYALGGLGTAGLGGYFQTFSNNTTPGSTSGAATRDTGSLGVSKDPTLSGLTTTSMEQDTDQYKYLYFYVGNFTQTALENTAGLNAELFNGKADIDLSNVSTTARSGFLFSVSQESMSAGNYYTLTFPEEIDPTKVKVNAYAVIKTANNNFAVGDVIPFESLWGQNYRPLSIRIKSTNLQFNTSDQITTNNPNNSGSGVSIASYIRMVFDVYQVK